MRQGNSATPLPIPPVMAVSSQDSLSILHARSTPLAHNAEAIHDIFCHCNMEKVYCTLENTHGFKAVRLPDCFCAICAQTKSQRSGLSHRRSLRKLIGPELPPDYVPPVEPAPMHLVSAASGSSPAPGFQCLHLDMLPLRNSSDLGCASCVRTGQ